MACSSEERKKNSFDGKDSVESPDGRPIVNVDEDEEKWKRRERWWRREFKFREGEELARRIREATNHGTGVSVVGRKVSLEGRRGPGVRGELGGAAITGMVESEEHRWRQETGRAEGGRREGGKGGGRAYGRLQTRGATCFMTSVHHIAPVS